MSAGVYIIAEAGVNHDGSPERALAMVDTAAAAGADAVKFQTFRPEALVTAAAPKARYQVANEGAGGQLEMLQRLALQEQDHFALVERCKERGIDFLSSPFDPASAAFLIDTLRLPCIKLGSGELTNGPLLLQMARGGRRLILSTGMSTLEEVEEALGVVAFGYSGRDGPSREAFRNAWRDPDLRTALDGRVTLLHCTSEYPCPPAAVNLRAMQTLHAAFDLPVGLSDHTVGIAAATAAVALGATVIEKHFTLDRNLPGPDHKASLEPAELAALVRSVREVEAALGSGRKQPDPGEEEVRRVARKGLVATRPIARGEPFGPDNLGAKRPAAGRSPMDYWSLLGAPASRDYAADEPIDP